jgi:nicotinate-nucleotide adenylyltransferase
MRVGIFGGTFDPPHVGHLLAASDAVEALALDRLLIIPAAEQPLKAGIVRASAAQRLEMTWRMAGRDPRFEVDPIEIERGGLSYTVETLRALRVRFAADSGLALFLLIGADVLATLPKWREPGALMTMADVVVLTRDGGGEVPPGMQALTTRRVDVSSTEIRTRVRDGRSIRGFVPDAVADYIATERLYR